MNDRELLEAAAKAAGMTLTDNGVRDLGKWEWLHCGDHEWGLYRNNANGTQRRWNPLLSDGDALRLAVKLDIFFGRTGVSYWARRSTDDKVFREDFEENGADPYAATRRAVVRAAAASGASHASGSGVAHGGGDE